MIETGNSVSGELIGRTTYTTASLTNTHRRPDFTLSETGNSTATNLESGNLISTLVTSTDDSTLTRSDIYVVLLIR